MHEFDQDSEKDLAQALNLLNRVVNRMRVTHEFAHELIKTIDSIEKSQYMQWLAKTRYEELHGKISNG